MTPSERVMPTLTVLRIGEVWRVPMYGNTYADLPDETAVKAVVSRVYPGTAIRWERPSRAAALPGASGGASYPEGGRQPTVAEETEGELRALFGDR